MNIDERVKLVKEVAEELISEEELRKLFEDKKKPIAYDGFEPSGKIHIAQGLLRSINVNKLTKAGIHFKFYVADWFAYLNGKMDSDMKKIQTTGEYFIEMWKACGMDMKNVEFIWTSDMIKNTDYWETVLKLSTHATVQRVLRCGQIMGRDDSISNHASHILYPLMQAADIYHLKADIAQLGLDQRKVNMLARELFPKLGLKAPIAAHHHMLMSLTEPKKKELTGADAAIEKKMSKSNSSSAIFMTDTAEEVEDKIMKAFCPEKEIKDNPVLDYCKHIIFEKIKTFEIKRSDKFGGDISFSFFDELAKEYSSGKIHPLDLKKATARYINNLLEPVRKHFSSGKAKKLLEEINSF